MGARKRFVGLAALVAFAGGCGGHGNSARETRDAGATCGYGGNCAWPDASGDVPAFDGIDASLQGRPDTGLAPTPTSCLPDGGVPGQPTKHRAQTVACVSAGASFGYPDANVTCGTNADCVDAGAALALDLKCLQGMCVVDECLADSDCPSGEACGCADQFYVNECVVLHCRVDADCGPGGFCSPSSASTCNGGALGTFCHAATDTCASDSDCTCLPSSFCSYEPRVGHWQCVSSDAWCVGP